MTARHDSGEILHEHHGIERVAAKTTANKERAGFAQVASNNWNVQVYTRGDVRDRVAVVIDGVRQQQIIHMTAMAGHIDYFLAFSHGAQGVGVVEFNAVV